MAEFEANATEKEKVSYPFLTLILAGGRGERLLSVTHGLIPKCFVTIDSENKVRGIDFLDSVFKKLSINNVVFSADYYYQQYQDFVSSKPYSMLYQRQNGGTTGAIEQAIEKFGSNLQYLVISPDTYFSPNDLAKLLELHKPDQITWAVSSDTNKMEPYHGLIVKNGSDTVIGDDKLGRWKGLDYPDSTKYVKGAINVVDPNVFIKSLSVHRRFCKKNDLIDFYWDFLPFFEEYNFRKVAKGFKSQLKAVIFENPIIDFGTPDRLAYTRKVYRNTQ